MTIYRKRGESVANIPFGEPSVLRTTVNFADIKSGATKMYDVTNSADVSITAGLATTDVLELFSLPAGTLVTDMGFRVAIAGTASGTGALGDGGSNACFGAAFALDGAADTSQITLVSDAYGPNSTTGKVYTTADTLDLTIADATMIIGEIDVWAIAYRVY